MAEVNAYATADQLREQLGETGTGNLKTALLERAVNAASRAVDQHCRRRFWLDDTATVKTYRPTFTDKALVDDIGDTTGLVVKTDSTGTGTFDLTWAATDYELEPLNALDPNALAWWWIVAVDRYLFPTARRVTLQVTAKFGWSGVPDDVEQATLMKAASLFKRKDAPFGVAGFNDFGVVRVTRQDGDVLDLLAPYRRMFA